MTVKAPLHRFVARSATIGRLVNRIAGVRALNAHPMRSLSLMKSGHFGSAAHLAPDASALPSRPSHNAQRKPPALDRSAALWRRLPGLMRVSQAPAPIDRRARRDTIATSSAGEPRRAASRANREADDAATATPPPRRERREALREVALPPRAFRSLSGGPLAGVRHIGRPLAAFVSDVDRLQGRRAATGLDGEVALDAGRHSSGAAYHALAGAGRAFRIANEKLS